MSNRPRLTAWDARLFERFLFVVFLFFAIAGCASHTRYYFYDGGPRSQAEVGVVVLQPNLMLVNLDGIPLAKFSKTYDVPPGEYTLDVIYGNVSEGSNKRTVTGGRITPLKFSAQPGHIYYIYPSFPSKHSWKPEVVDFAKPEDLSNFKQDFLSDLDSADRIRERVEQHFQVESTHGLHVSGRKHWE